MRLGRLCLGLVGLLWCCSCGVLATSAGATQTTITQLYGGTEVRAWHGVQAWPQYSPDDKRWHVTVRHDGQISMPAAIAAGDGRMQVDVGPGPNAKPRLAFTSCADVCRVVVSDLDGGRARTVPGSERARNPTIWGSRVAWVRDDATVLTSGLDGAAATTLPGVPTQKCYVVRGEKNVVVNHHVVTRRVNEHRCDRTSGGFVYGLELRGEHLALLVGYQVVDRGDTTTTEVRMQPLRHGQPRTVALMNTGIGEAAWEGPSWLNGALYFYRSCPDGCDNVEGVYRYRPDTGVYARAPRNYFAVSGFAMDEDGLHAFMTPAANGRRDSVELVTSLQLTGQLHFMPARAPISGPG